MAASRLGLLTGWIVAAGLGAATAVVVQHWIPDDDVRTVEGEVGDVTGSGAAIDVDGEGYLIGTGLRWQGVDGTWHESGQPECLPPLSGGARVQLGIMAVPPEETGIGSPNHVVWVRCLTLPTETNDHPAPPVPLDAPYQRAREQAGG